jgi:hypothetical protein
MASTVDKRVFLVAMSRLASNHTGPFAKDKCGSGRPLPVCHRVQYNRPWAMEMWATLRTKKRATRKTPGCRNRSRQFYKGYIGNAQYDRVEAHFRILKGLGSADLVKCLRSSSDPLYTGSNLNIHLSFKKKKKKIKSEFFLSNIGVLLWIVRVINLGNFPTYFRKNS